MTQISMHRGIEASRIAAISDDRWQMPSVWMVENILENLGRDTGLREQHCWSVGGCCRVPMLRSASWADILSDAA